MRKSLFCFDLAVCSLWTMAALGSRTAWFASPAMWIVMLLLMVSRILLSFTLYNREKKAWIPGLLFIGLTFLTVGNGLDVKHTEIASKIFPLLNIGFNHSWYEGLNVAIAVWLWIVPLVVFLVNMFRKDSLLDSLTWKDALGKVLWTDRMAKTYCSLLLIAIGTLYAGLNMEARLCLFACVVAPTSSLYLLNQYYGVPNRRLWVLAASMLIFFFAQTHAGWLRMAMLGISFCMAAYVCSGFYKSRKNMVLAFFSSIYLGIMLPSLAIGNNQYTCFSVGRTAYHSLGSYPGIFCVEDKKIGKVGLRDRYGLLVKPEYESFRYHTPSHWFGELELRKNGYYILYDICNDKYRSDDDIDHQLQDRICQIVEKHLAECSYQADDRLEVKVTVPSTNKTLAHVKVLKNGTVCYYDYDKAPYIPTDSLANEPGAIACDTSVQFKWCQKKSLSYLQEATSKDTLVHQIQVTLARDKMPERKEAAALAEEISLLLR